MALTDNILAYWGLGEASGTRADATGNGNDLSPSGTPGNTTGVIGSGVQLVGASSQYLTRAKASLSAGFTGYASHTLTFWMNSPTWTTTTYFIISHRNATGGAFSMTNSGGAGLFYHYLSSAFSPITLSASGNNTTTFFAVGYNAATGKQFVSVNGGALTESSRTFTNNGGDFSIGYDTSGGLAKFNGWIDEVGFWTRALSLAEIQQLYNSGAGLAYPFTTSTPAMLHAAQRAAFA